MIMKRIVIIGSGGAGKSTFARRLSKANGIEVIHLDKIYWQPNWIKPNKQEWRANLANLVVEKDSWIMDGNYDSSLEIRLDKCDTVIFLEMPRTICLYRVLKRVIKYRYTSRPDMADGCHEKMDWEFVKWIWEYPKKDKLKVEAKLGRFKEEIIIIRLKSKKDVENFFVNLPETEVKSN